MEFGPPRAAVAVLFLIVAIAYIPALRAGYIWDDDDYVTENATLRSHDGLARIWLEPGATPQYYPLVHTTFWIEYRLWGLHPAGYHAINVGLHALVATLLYILLRRLKIRAAWIAAAIFALHPVHVESVAWITERKNVLSAVFYLSSALAYLSFMERSAAGSRGRWGGYALATILFIAALLSKTVTATLPAALLLVIWWRNGRIALRDFAPLAPWLLIGAAMGLWTAWIEAHNLGGTGYGATGAEWDYGMLDRALIAARAVWFYAAKLLLPINLAFIYHRWLPEEARVASGIALVSLIALVAILFVRRKEWGRGPLTAVLFFIGTLFPALGFFNVYPMRYSFVADHFQYLASIGPIVLVSQALPRARTIRSFTLPAVLLLGLGGLTFARTLLFRDEKTLWTETIRQTPTAWIAHNNLGRILAAEGRYDEAIDHYRRALELRNDLPETHFNMGFTLAQKADLAAAASHFREATRLRPDYLEAQVNLADTLARSGDWEGASRIYEGVLTADPGYAFAWMSFGGGQFRRGNHAEARRLYARAAELDPTMSEAWNGLGAIAAIEGGMEEAAAHFRRAIELAPENAVARANLARAEAELSKKLSPGTEK